MRKYLIITFLLLTYTVSAFAGRVYWEPTNPVPGENVTIYYNVIQGTLPDDANLVWIHLGYNDWQNTNDYQMTEVPDTTGWWKYDYTIPGDATVVDFVFTDMNDHWDNNGGVGVDWHIPLTLNWSPFSPNPNDTLHIQASEVSPGDQLLWWVVSDDEPLTPISQYRPDGSVLSDDGMVVKSPFTDENEDTVFDVALGPFLSARQTFDRIKFKVQYADGTVSEHIYEISMNYGGRNGDPEVTITSPDSNATVSGATPITASATGASSVEFWGGSDSLGVDSSAPYEINWTPTNSVFGTTDIVAKAVDDSGHVTFAKLPVSVPPTIEHAPIPDGVSDGINIDGNQITITLYAPYKDYVAVRGSWNRGFQEGELMKLSGDTLWWYQTNLSAGAYFYQYNLEGKKRIADPWSKDIRWKQFGTNIESGNYEDAFTKFVIGEEPYLWTDEQFQAPANDEVMVYEAYLGDFNGEDGTPGTYADMLAKVQSGYFDSLGVTAVELMPVNEFEGDQSWGYNPSFYLAPESSYGTPAELKELVNAFHSHGIALYLDVVFNHMWGSAPLFQLYQPVGTFDRNDHDYAHDPYFHDMDSQWGYKLEHWHGTTSAGVTRRTWKYVTDCLRNWVENYHVDGFRFDYADGIGWGEGDNGMSFYANFLHGLDRDVFVIAESDNAYQVNATEVDGGWNYSYYHMMKANLQEISDGGHSYGDMNDLGRHIRFNVPDYSGENAFQDEWGPVNYLESHDETRVIYEGMHYQGFSREKAIKKLKLGAAILFTGTGTPMIYQGQEFGQDGRTRDSGGYPLMQPLQWSYLNEDWGADLFKYYRKMIWLRNNFPVLHSANLDITHQDNSTKTIVYERNGGIEYIVVAANFSGSSHTLDIEFPTSGNYYEFIRNDSVTVANDTLTNFTLQPYSAYIWTNDWLWTDTDPDLPEVPATFEVAQNYPNPFNPTTTIKYQLPEAANVVFTVFNIRGEEVAQRTVGHQAAGHYQLNWTVASQSSGMYFYTIEAHTKAKNYRKVKKLIIVK